MAANLKAKVSLDTSEFSKGITSLMSKASSAASALKGVGTVAFGAAAGVAAIGAAAVAALAPGIKAALDFGSAMSELSARTGVGAGDLSVLQQAFKAAGLSADSVGPMINRMQKALTGVNEQGEPTNKTFAALGINLAELKGKAPAAQFEAIGKAISGIKDPAERAAASMGIFGKSGGEMLAIFSDPAAMGSAAGIIGSQAEILNRSAARFDDVSDKLNSVGVKIRGFFLGMAESLLPALERAASFLASLDLAPIGKKLGDAIQSAVNILVNAFQQGKLGELFALSIKVGAMKGVDFLVRAMTGVANIIQEILGQAMAALFDSDFREAMVQGYISAISRIAQGLMTILGGPLSAIQNGVTNMFTGFMVKLEELKHGWAILMGDKAGEDASLQKLKDLESTKGDTSAFSFGGVTAQDAGNKAELAIYQAAQAWDRFQEKGLTSLDAIVAAFMKGMDGKSIFANLPALEEQLKNLATSLNVPLEKVKEAAAKVATGDGSLNPGGVLKKNEAASQLERIGAIIPKGAGGGGPTPALTHARKTSENTTAMLKNTQAMLRLMGINVNMDPAIAVFAQ